MQPADAYESTEPSDLTEPPELTARAFPEFCVTRAGEMKFSAPEPGLRRHVGAYNDKLLLVEHRMIQGWQGALHSHPHEQVVYVVSGHLTVTVSGTTFDVREGDSFVVRGGVEHQAMAREDSVVIDVFTPCREDYL
jgi:quercetin dioxygenase-like cupin family protein